MDATTAIVLGAAVVVVGYLVIQSNKSSRPEPAVPPASTSTAGGLLGQLLGSKTANDIGASLLSKISVSLGGSSSW